MKRTQYKQTHSNALHIKKSHNKANLCNSWAFVQIQTFIQEVHLWNLLPSMKKAYWVKAEFYM
jgi:hypothetical protein